MTTRITIFRSCPILFLIISAGCSEGTPSTYPVVVKVVYPDKTPVVGAQVVFRSAEHKTTARGATDDTGVCRLTTFADDDGAILGRHLILVAKPPLLGDPDDPYSGPLIANKFASIRTSGLEATVSEVEADNVFPLTVTPR